MTNEHRKEGSDSVLPTSHSRKTVERTESANEAMFQRSTRTFRSGSLGRTKLEDKADDPYSLIKTDLSTLSGLLAASNTMAADHCDSHDSPLAGYPKHNERLSGPLNDWSASIRQDIVRHAQKISAAHREYGKPRTRESVVRLG